MKDWSIFIIDQYRGSGKQDRDIDGKITTVEIDIPNERGQTPGVVACQGILDADLLVAANARMPATKQSNPQPQLDSVLIAESLLQEPDRDRVIVWGWWYLGDRSRWLGFGLFAAENGDRSRIPRSRGLLATTSNFQASNIDNYQTLIDLIANNFVE